METPRNSLFALQPYWLGGTWVFDAPQVGLTSEPFIAGSDTVLTRLVHKHLSLKPEAGSQFQLVFSHEGFPGFHLRFERKEAEFNGHWYLTEEGDWSWLCAGMNYFFEQGHPEQLYVRVQK